MGQGESGRTGQKASTMSLELRNADWLREMFSGWDNVMHYEDVARGEFVAVLRVSETNLYRARDHGQVIDRLWPKPVKLRGGVRFHGRRVGKR